MHSSIRQKSFNFQKISNRVYHKQIQRNELDIERSETLIIVETFDFTDENTKLTFKSFLYLHFFPFHNERVFLCGSDESLLNEAVALQPSQVLLPTFEL